MAKYRALCLLAAAVFPLAAIADPPKVLDLPFVKERRPRAETPLQRRKGTGPVALEATNWGLFYLASVSIGTPPQNLMVTLDTGSSDLWVPAINSTICKNYTAECAAYGQYDITKTTTAKNLGTLFNSSYGQGSGPIGVNVLDTVGIGSASLQSLQFGNAYDEPGLISLATGDNVQGIMGISFEAGEAQVAFERKKPYTNVVGALKEEGYINTMGYSLFLDSQEASSGSILFGGVDTSKYTGDLVSLDIVPPFVKGTPPSMTVQLTGISASYSDADNVLHTASLTSDSLIPVILDSGTTDIQLSPPLVNAMSRFMGAVPIPANPGFGYVPCNLSTANASFTFTLGGAHGVNITAPMSEMVFDWQGDFTFADGTRACQIGVDASEPYILGDSFLRSAYAVFNLESKQIGLAQAAVRASTAISSSGTILEIPPSGIPSAVRSVPVLSIPSSISLSHPPQSSPTAIDEGEGGGRGGRKHKHPFPFPSSFSSAINATTTENPATTLTVGTVDVLPSHASFTATGAAPLEPSVYLEAARIAGAPPASGGGGVNTTTTAAGTGAAMPTGAGMGSVVSAYSSSSNGYRGVMYAAGSGRLGVMVGVVGWAVWGAGL